MRWNALFQTRKAMMVIALVTLAGYGCLVFAAAPPGGYTPAQTLDPDCAPGDTDCSVTISSTVADDSITFAKIQNITDNRILGRSAGSDGDAQELTVGTGLSLAGGVLSAVAGSGWSLTGNSGTVPGTNFIGTTDATDFVMSTDGTERARILSSGGIAIGRSTVNTIAGIADKLSVDGNISNPISSTNQPLIVTNDTTVGTLPISISIQKNLMYVVNYKASNNLSIYDISNKTSPVLISTTTITGSSLPTYVRVSGNYVYVIDSGANRLFTIDVTNPAVPSLTTSTTVSGSPRYFIKKGSLIFVTCFNSNTIQVLDVSNPTGIRSLSTTTVGTNPRAIEISGKYAYVANYGSGNVSIVDITTPTAPTVAATLTVGTGSALTRPHHINIKGKYMYVLLQDENKIEVYDISTPTSPVLVGTPLSMTALFKPYSAVSAGDYLYVSSNATSDIAVVSIEDPLTPTIVSQLTVGSVPAYTEIVGRYLYIPVFSGAKNTIVDVKGTQTNGFHANSLFAGDAHVQDRLIVDGYTELSDGLFVGDRGMSVNGLAAFRDAIASKITMDGPAYLTTAAIGNTATSGNLGAALTAAATVDIRSAFILTQTTANRTIALPDPTVTTSGRIVSVTSSASSTQNFTFYGSTVFPGDTRLVLWNGTAWTLIGDGSGANGTPFSTFTAAKATNSIDNLNFAQTWAWSTAAAQSPLALSADALTSGSLLALSSTNTTTTGNLLSVTSASTSAFANGGVRFNFSGAHTGNGFQINDVTSTGKAAVIIVNSLTTGTGLGISSSAAGIITAASSNTGLLLDVTESGNMSAMTGSLASVSATGTSTVGATGNILNLNASGTAQIMKVLNVTSSSTGNLATGGVRFNFSGAHTGSGFLIDSATATGSAMTINANSVTTGNALQVLSSYASGNSTNGLVYIANTSAVTNGTILRAQSNSTAGSGLTVLASGNVGIANAAPSILLHVGSSSVTTGTSVARFENAGGTCTVTPNVAGGITCTSDINLKKNITGLPAGSVLDKIMGVDVKEYNMLADADGSAKQIGFIAQNLETMFPSVVMTDERGFKSVSYGAMTPILTAAIKEMNIKLENIETVSERNTIRDAFMAWFADIGNGIERIYAKVLSSDRVETKELCVGNRCITEEQFNRLLDAQGIAPGPAPAPSVAPIVDPAPTEPSDAVSQEAGVGTIPVTPETLPADAEPAPEPSLEVAQ